MIKTRTWLLLLAALLLAAGLFWWLGSRRNSGSVVQVIHDGQLLREIDLSDVREPYEFVWEDDAGNRNRVRVEPGRIAVTDANCPDRLCVHQGWLSRALPPIVCLPHRLMIQWKEASP